MCKTHDSTTVCKTRVRQRFGPPQNGRTNRKYGRCLICSERVHSKDNYVVTQQGYCCEGCLGKITEEMK